MSVVNADCRPNNSESSSQPATDDIHELSTHSSGSSGSTKPMVSSGEGTVIFNRKPSINSTAEDDSNKINDDKDDEDQHRQPPKSTNFVPILIMQYIDELQYKITLYEKELQSYENLDFNVDSMFSFKNQANVNSDFDLHASKTMAKAREQIEQLSLLNRQEWKPLETKFNGVEECLEEFVNHFKRKIHHFTYADQA